MKFLFIELMTANTINFFTRVSFNKENIETSFYSYKHKQRFPLCVYHFLCDHKIALSKCALYVSSLSKEKYIVVMSTKSRLE